MSSLKKQRIIYGILLAVWMAVIFIMSAQPAEESSQLSGGLVSKVVKIIYPNFDNMSETQQSGITNTVTFIVRKVAHFSEYFVLGVLGFLVVNTYQKYKFALRALFAIIFCALYAVSDEIHQYFVPGRACRFIDICIDSVGSAVAIVILTLIFYCKKRQKSGELNAKKETD